MRFYLLKSTKNRENAKDIIIDLESVISIKCVKRGSDYIIAFEVHDGHYKFVANNEQELRDELKSILKSCGSDESIADDVLIDVDNEKADLSDLLKEVLKKARC